MNASSLDEKRIDLLSEVLRTVKLKGALFFNAEFSTPWCIQSRQPSSVADVLSSLLHDPSPSGTSRLIVFHFLTEGRAHARLVDGSRVELGAGDIVIIPQGDSHFVGNGSPEKPVDSFVVFAKNVAEGLKVARFGGGGEVTRFVCGFMACDARMSDVFLSSLPAILKVNVATGTSGQWLAHSIRFAVDQAGESSAGSNLVLSRLAEVLFVQSLRQYINTLPADRTGWFAGTRDPVVGRALELFHKEPAVPWNISDLARRTGVSRTRLIERFHHFLGEPPMAYLTRWRMRLGAEILESTEDTVVNVADAVGYGSEAAFNRAFKREFGVPPAQFRRGVMPNISRGDASASTTTTHTPPPGEGQLQKSATYSRG
jgi:AraC-like DNA-binding protein